MNYLHQQQHSSTKYKLHILRVSSVKFLAWHEQQFSYIFSSSIPRISAFECHFYIFQENSFGPKGLWLSNRQFSSFKFRNWCTFAICIHVDMHNSNSYYYTEDRQKNHALRNDDQAQEYAFQTRRKMALIFRSLELIVDYLGEFQQHSELYNINLTGMLKKHNHFFTQLMHYGLLNL